ncbi:MAG: hypothetical protein M9949_02685 [Candidatus Kapabacteria bacterium]|nr:hypothetical protein [Candidatus Kapabacteria bacterium]
MSKFLIVVLFILLAPAYLASQGCSDAGVCSMLGDKDIQPEEEKYIAGLSQYFGVGDENTVIFNTLLTFDYRSENMDVSVILPYVYTNGNLGTLSGLGDIKIAAGFTGSLSEDAAIKFIAGVKFATGEANGKKSGRSLPMVYQPGLGTSDLMLGASLRLSTWVFGVGFQFSDDRTSNKFLHEDWVDEDEAALHYNQSFKMRRGMDFMLSVDKFVNFDKTSIYGGIQVIHRNEENNVRRYNFESEKYEITEQNLTTVNLRAGLKNNLTDYAALHLEVALPILARDYAADGLTRSFSAAFGLKFNL